MITLRKREERRFFWLGSRGNAFSKRNRKACGPVNLMGLRVQWEVQANWLRKGKDFWKGYRNDKNRRLERSWIRNRKWNSCKHRMRINRRGWRRRKYWGNRNYNIRKSRLKSNESKSKMIEGRRKMRSTNFS